VNEDVTLLGRADAADQT